MPAETVTAVTGGYSRLAYLDGLVELGCVRCGVCGWRIGKGQEWQTVDNGPQHVRCERVGEPPEPDDVRLWSTDW